MNCVEERQSAVCCQEECSGSDVTSRTGVDERTMWPKESQFVVSSNAFTHPAWSTNLRVTFPSQRWHVGDVDVLQ
jgi:hypothetical protein